MTDNCIHGVALDETCVLCCRNSARQYRNQRDDCKRDLEAANIEVAHLREAFMTMEKAYNALALRTCAACRRSVRYTDHGILYCDLLRSATSDTPCQLVGNTCGAWAALEASHD